MRRELIRILKSLSTKYQMYQMMGLWEGKICRFLVVGSFHTQPPFSFDIIDYFHSARSDLEVVLTSMLDNLFHQQCSEPKQVVEVFINAANLTSDGLSFEDFQTWCAHLPAVRKYLACLLTPSDSGFSLSLPECVFHEVMSLCSSDQRYCKQSGSF